MKYHGDSKHPEPKLPPFPQNKLPWGSLLSMGSSLTSSGSQALNHPSSASCTLAVIQPGSVYLQAPEVLGPTSPQLSAATQLPFLVFLVWVTLAASKLVSLLFSLLSKEVTVQSTAPNFTSLVFFVRLFGFYLFVSWCWELNPGA